MTPPFEIGERVHFRDRGATREGRIVGTEFVENPRIAKRGWNFLIRTEALELLTVHYRDVVGRVVQPTELSAFG